MAQERESCSFPGASLPPSWGWSPTPSQGLNSQCKIHIHEVSWPEVSNCPFQTCGYSPSKSIQIQRKDPRCCRRRQKEETSLPFLPRASMLTQPVCPCRKKEQHPAQTSCASVLSRCFTLPKWGAGLIKGSLEQPSEVGAARPNPSSPSSCPSPRAGQAGLGKGLHGWGKSGNGWESHQREEGWHTGPARGGRRSSDDATGDVRTSWDPKNVEQSSS